MSKTKIVEIFIKLKNVNWTGLTKVYFENDQIWAYDSIAERDVPVQHLMSKRQIFRVKSQF